MSLCLFCNLGAVLFSPTFIMEACGVTNRKQMSHILNDELNMNHYICRLIKYIYVPFHQKPLDSLTTQKNHMQHT